MDRIYLDHAATTPLDPAVLEAMMPYLTDRFGNASSVHHAGRQARHAVEESRERVASCLGAEPAEILFTSGGTEANTTALKGVLGATGGHLVSSAVEHEAVLRPAAALARAGHAVSILRPGATGAVTAEQVVDALRPETTLVSLMLVNNELGTVTPIRDIAQRCREAGVWMHTDAVQAAGGMALDVEELGVDLMTLSGHKVYGPKGVGVLYVRSGVDLQSILEGGAQERGRRGGTENVAAIVGFAEALDRAARHLEERAEHCRKLQYRLYAALQAIIGGALVVNTPFESGSDVAPHILNVSLSPAAGGPLDGEMLLLNLDLEGVMVSAGSACTSGALEPSHVLLALGRDRATAQATLRFSIGKDTTADDVDRAVARLAVVLRRMHALADA